MIEKLVLGTVQFGLPYGINNCKGQPTAEESYSLFDIAYQSGIRCVDTAESYGEAQEVIGKYHRQNENRKFSVITKYSAPAHGLSSVEFVDRVSRNLDDLNIASLEAYLFHNFNSYKSFEHWGAVEKLRNKKQLNKIGVSVYTNEQAFQVAVDPRVEVVQLPFNLLDNLSLRGHALKQLHEQKKEVHIRSVFLQGLFYKDRNGLKNLTPLKESLVQLDGLAKEAGMSLGTLALSYCLRQPLIDKVLIGVETESQLTDNIEIAMQAVSVDEEIFSAINKVQVNAPQLLNPSNWV